MHFDNREKIGQGQPRVIIYTNVVDLDPPPEILHTKFQGDRPSGFEKKT